MSYLQLFIQNLCLEAIPLLLIFRGIPLARWLTVVFLANALTHPWVFFFFTALPEISLVAGLLIAEGFSIAVEGYLYAHCLRCGWLKAGLAALATNIISWQLGPILSYGLAKFYGTP